MTKERKKALPQNRPANPLDTISAASDLMRIPSPRRIHTAWLFCKAGYTEISLKTELELLGIPRVAMKAFRNRSGYWMPAKTAVEKNEYERRARKALSLEQEDRPELQDPIPHDELLFVGNWQEVFLNMGAVPNDPSSSVKIGVPSPVAGSMDEGSPRVTSIQGMPLPDIVRTIQEAEKAGVGMREMILKISSMVSAECVMVPGRMGWAKVPIQQDRKIKKGDFYFIAGLEGQPVEREAYDDGVVLAGMFYDSSYICPDQETRAKGLQLAKQIIGNNDIEHLKKITDAIKATSMAEAMDDLQRKRLEVIRQEQSQGLDPSREVGTGGISMVRPKVKSPEEFNKGKDT